MPRDLTVKEAARRLGVSERWLRALAERGDVRASRAGWSYLIDANDVARLKRRSRPPGRPLSARSAWALLAVLSGDEPEWVTPSARSRLRTALRYGARPADLLRHSQPRSELFRWRVLGRDLRKILEDYPLKRSGLSAVTTRINVVRPHDAPILDGYVALDARDAIRTRFKPDTSTAEPNLVLRVPAEPWVLQFDREAPRAVVAADLLEHDDARVVRAGEEILERLHHDPDS